MEKIVFVFNKFYTSLIKNLKTNETLKLKLKNSYKAIDKLSVEYIEHFWESFEGKFCDPAHDKFVLKNVMVGDVLSEFSGDDSNIFWNYYYVLAVLALVHREADEVLAMTVLDILNKKQKNIDAAEEIALVLQDDVQEILGKIGATPGIEEAAAAAENPFASVLKGMEGSKICSLAQEISNDIDVSKIKVDSPEDIMNLLDFSGSNNFMGDIIKKVSSKMQEKISTGELKQEDLFGEAMNMMGKMNLGGTSSLFNNPMMSEMMKMVGKGKGRMKSARPSSRDALRRKLEERRNKII